MISLSWVLCNPCTTLGTNQESGSLSSSICNQVRFSAVVWNNLPACNPFTVTRGDIVGENGAETCLPPPRWLRGGRSPLVFDIPCFLCGRYDFWRLVKEIKWYISHKISFFCGGGGEILFCPPLANLTLRPCQWFKKNPQSYSYLKHVQPFNSLWIVINIFRYKWNDV